MTSIVIPVYNQHDLTDECIRAVLENTQDMEIIIVDNGSEPPIKPPFSGFTPITVIRNLENKGFPVAVNQGIRAAVGDTIILLNNDVIVTPGALNRLAVYLDAFSIVGPVTNYCAGMQKVTLPVYNSIDGLNKEAGHLAEECKDEIEEVNFIIGFCMAFKKSLADELLIGVNNYGVNAPNGYSERTYFDESLWPCSGEEIDFCLKARAAGHKVGIAQDVYVHHEGSKTFKELMPDSEYEYICKRNDAHLAEKWGADFWQRQAVVTKSDGIRLNLGCGQYPLPGFVNVDQFANVNPDLLADALRLPYEPGTVDEIYCGHMLEHLTWKEGQAALKHWYTLLKPGGVIGITVPDFDFLVKRYLENPTVENLREMNDLYIFSYVQESHHRYVYSEALLKEALQQAGFIELERLPVDHPYFVDPVDWQVGIKGVRP